MLTFQDLEDVLNSIQSSTAPKDRTIMNHNTNSQAATFVSAPEFNVVRISSIIHVAIESRLKLLASTTHESQPCKYIQLKVFDDCQYLDTS